MKITYSDAQKIRDVFCRDFDLPKCPVFMDTTACRVQEAKGLYIKGKIILPKRLNLYTLLHELAHHLQYCRFDIFYIGTTHGNAFTRAKRQVATWAKRNVDTRLRPHHLNAYI